jgi:nicotinamide-nucleotide adenylyltransferase
MFFADICIKTMTRRLLILDASFNPPTIAHYQLLHQTSEALGKPPWLLLHSTRNADKSDSQSVHIHQLMLRMELEIQQRHPGQPVSSLVLNDAPRFIDKVAYLSEASPKELHFILGQDTLVRFFNDKYYPQGQSSQVFSEFFSQGAEIWVAPRSLTGQTGYKQVVEEVRELLSHHAPNQVSEWMGHLHEIPGWNTHPARELSSTRVRNNVQLGHKDLVLKDVFPSVAEYIYQNGLYSPQ